MSLSGKYTTIYDIIERVKRAGFNDFTEEEAKEWAWECISLLGITKHYYSKVAVLLVENGRAMLPYDLYDLTESGVREYYSKVPLILEMDIYHNPDTVGVIDNTLFFNTEAESVVFVNGEEVDASSFLTSIPNYNYQGEFLTYRINNGFIETGFKDGVIEIAYKAFPVDSDYNPMIEDNMKTIRFVVSYIEKQIATRMWLNDEISDKKKQLIDQQYSFAAASARSDGGIEGIEQMEAIKNRILRLRRDPNMHRIGYKGFGYREGLNL